MMLEVIRNTITEEVREAIRGPYSAGNLRGVPVVAQDVYIRY